LLFGRGVFIRCVFALSDVGIEGAGGEDFIGERYARVWSGGEGTGDTRQQVRWRGGTVLPAMMAAMGALQRGRGVVVVRMEAGMHVGGTGEWWGR
jgi:hypothetical protein